MAERSAMWKRWVQRGRFAVAVEIEVVYPNDDPSEPCLEPEAVRKLDEIARRAGQGDLAYLRTIGRVFEAVASWDRRPSMSTEPISEGLGPARDSS